MSLFSLGGVDKAMKFKHTLVGDYRAKGENAFYIVRERREKGYRGYWQVLVFVEDQLAAELDTVAGSLIPTREKAESLAAQYDKRGSGLA